MNAKEAEMGSILFLTLRQVGRWTRGQEPPPSEEAFTKYRKVKKP